MAVIVPNMQMPKKCGECRLCYHDDYFTGNTDNYRCVLFPGYPKDLNLEGKIPNCPLKEIPKGHGRLIDADKLKGQLQDHHDFYISAYDGFKNLPQNDKARVDEITASIASVVNARTIIEADKQKSEGKNEKK